MKLRLTPKAISNIEAIAEYVREQNPSAARRLRAVIDESLGRLLLFPHLGRPQIEPGVRKLVTPRFDYLIYYWIQESEQEIVILSVRHAAQEREYDDS